MMLFAELVIKGWIIALIAAVVIAIIVLYIIFGKGKRLNKEVDFVESRLDAVNLLDIKEKIAKLEVIGRNNIVFANVYSEYQGEFEANEEYKTAEINPDIDKVKLEIKEKKYDLARELLDNINSKAEIYEEKVEKIRTRLEEILQQEVDTKSYETKVRELFSGYKELYRSMKDDVSTFANQLETRENDIDNLFLGYKSNVDDGRFEDAKETLQAIEKQTNEATAYLNENRDAIVRVTKDLPARLNELIATYNSMLKEGYPLYNLNMGGSVNNLSARLSNLVSRLRVFNPDGIIVDSETLAADIEKLSSKLGMERDCRIEFDTTYNSCYNDAVEIERNHTKNIRELAELRNYYKIDDETNAKANNVRIEVNKLKDIKKDLDEVTLGRQQPYSYRVIKIRELSEQINTVKARMEEYRNAFIFMKDVTEKAYNQIYDTYKEIKGLQLDVRNSKHSVLMSKYNNEFNRCYRLIETLDQAIHDAPIDVQIVKSNSLELTQLSEELRNQIQKELANKKVAENIIMYSNAYRSSFADVANALTKAETAYFNGDFEEAIEITDRVVQDKFQFPEELRHNIEE